MDVKHDRRWLGKELVYRDQDWNLEKSYFTSYDFTYDFISLYLLICRDFVCRVCIFIDELLLRNTSDKFVCKRSNLLKRRLLEQSLFTSTTSAFFERPREFRVPCRIRAERNARKKHAIFVRRYECRQTKLHEITFSRCTLLGSGTKERVRIEARSRKGASGKRKPIFVHVLSSVKGWTTWDFRRWAHSIFGERGGFLPTAAAIASRRLEKCCPGKATSRWGAFFVNVTFSIVWGRRYFAAFLQKCSLELHS